MIRNRCLHGLTIFAVLISTSVLPAQEEKKKESDTAAETKENKSEEKKEEEKKPEKKELKLAGVFVSEDDKVAINIVPLTVNSK